MKCCGMWYLEAIRRLKLAEESLERTVHMVFVPDEEVGSKTGMGAFVQSDLFKKLNVGFCMDEGLANPTDAFSVFYGGRSAWWFTITCPGNPGHGSRFIKNTAAEMIAHQSVLGSLHLCVKITGHRLESNPHLKLGDVTTVNVTVLSGGIQFNVVPSEMSIKVDVRIPPTDSHEELEANIQSWVESAGKDCTISFDRKESKFPVTNTESPWWKAFSAACCKHNLVLEREILSTGSDCGFLRMLNIPALGFSAINNTPILLHDHNEFLNEKTFLRGIDIYQDIIRALTSVVE